MADVVTRPIQPQRTVFPSHLVRQLAHQRTAPHLPFDTWIEQQWIQFARRHGYRSRSSEAHGHFDRYMESMK
ncbi:hypothetical protein [Thauera aromatica]|uniref:hypothetical protein n=1 Tax=Thauera aromatica TaxID=59405 RepID=UPI001FFD90CE|nr:hypothetical protein [Thauera aromatica]MCK2097717.1 hypothetical protein [Thauera aromatica]